MGTPVQQGHVWEALGGHTKLRADVACTYAVPTVFEWGPVQQGHAWEALGGHTNLRAVVACTQWMPWMSGQTHVNSSVFFVGACIPNTWGCTHIWESIPIYLGIPVHGDALSCYGNDFLQMQQLK